MKPLSLWSLLFAMVLLIGPGLRAEEPPGTASSDAPGAVEALPGPKLAISELKFEFTDVDPGTQVTHDFMVTNEGESDLVIDKVQPG